MNLSKGRRQLRTRLLEKNLKSKLGNSYSDLKDLRTTNCGLMPLNVLWRYLPCQYLASFFVHAVHGESRFYH